MPDNLRGILTVAGRIMLSVIFLMSGVGNKIPNYNGVVEAMRGQGVPAPQLLLAIAIAFLIFGSISLILGLKARIGASMLAIFLVLATYYFHDFWNFPAEEQQNQIIQFSKNLSMLGAMVFIIANGAGPWSLDECLTARKSSDENSLPPSAA